MTQEPSAAFEAVYDSGTSGLVGTIAARIEDNDGAIVVAATTAGISELGTTGIYSAELTAPAAEGQFSIVWSNDGSFTADAGVGVEDLLVTTAILGLSPLPPLITDAGAIGPPCSAWTSREAVSGCCEGFSDDTTDNQDAAIRAATEILFEVADRLYSGECSSGYVRPCRQSCSCWGPWSYGTTYTWDPHRATWACDGHACGCSPTSEVVLAGVPIREIEEVLIDGIALDTSEYALMEPNRLVRLRDLDEPNARNVWPGCQTMDLPETEEGTFAISYTYGADPPQAGRSAAAALACEIWRACPSGTGDCVLPEGVTRVIRQGVTHEIAPMAAAELKNGQTGIPAIDSFVAIFAGGVAQSRSSVWSPDLDYPRRFRAAAGT